MEVSVEGGRGGGGRGGSKLQDTFRCFSGPANLLP